MDKKSIQKVFQGQNITIRKGIRELDMPSDQINNNHLPYIKRNDVNLLVVGPHGAGKSTLLKQYFGNLEHFIMLQMGICVVIWKQGSQENAHFKGLTKLKQSDDKLGVYGFEPCFSSHSKNQMDKYARAIEMINNKTIGCMGQSIFSGNTFSSINYVLITLDVSSKIQKQESTALKFFLAELDEKKIKYSIVGTHLDQILGKDILNGNEEQETMIYLQNWKKMIQVEINLKNSVEIYCMQNYWNIGNKETFQNSETINYYALVLLQKCIKRAPQSDKQKKISSKFFCF